MVPKEDVTIVVPHRHGGDELKVEDDDRSGLVESDSGLLWERMMVVDLRDDDLC